MAYFQYLYRRLVTVLLTMFCLSSGTTYLIGQQYSFTYFGTDTEQNPLPKSAITEVIQDDQGFVWMAAYGFGLCRYDGTEMLYLGDESGVPRYSFELFEDHAGRLWVPGANQKTFVSSRPLDDYSIKDSITFKGMIGSSKLPARQASLSRSDLIVGSDGTVWASVDSFMLKMMYHDLDSVIIDTISLSAYKEEGFKYIFSCGVPQEQGDLVFLNSLQYVYRYHNSGDSVSVKSCTGISKDVLRRENIQNIFEGPDGIKYVLTTGGYFLHLEISSTAHLTEIEVLEGMQIKHISFQDGLLLLSTTGYGLLYYDPIRQEIVNRVTMANGLPSNIIWRTMFDEEDNLWIATNSGVARAPGDYLAFGHYSDELNENDQKILPSKEANNVEADIYLNVSDSTSTRYLGVCTHNGFALVDQQGVSEIIDKQRGLISNTVVGCHQDLMGRIYVLTTEGVHCIAPTRSMLKSIGVNSIQRIDLFGEVLFHGPTPIIDMTVVGETYKLPTTKRRDKYEDVTFLLGRTLAWILHDGRYYYLEKEAGINTRSLNNITVDDDGNIYMSTTNGGILQANQLLTIADIKTWSTTDRWKDKSNRFAVTDTVFTSRVLTYQGDTIKSAIHLAYLHDQLWLSCELGLAVIDQEAWEVKHVIQQSYAEARPNPIGMVSDKDGVWVGQTGLYHVDATTYETGYEVLAKDGLVSDIAWGLPGLDIDRNGVLYFATNKGVSMYNPALDKIDTIPPVAYVSNLDVAYPSLSSNQVNISYAGRSYGKESQVRYKTKLIGQDADWSEETSSSSIRYTNLKAFLFPKSYRFEVVARDVHGNWQVVPSSISFKIKPQWYAHWLAVLVYLVLLYLLAKWYSNYRNRQLIRRQEVLEQTVKERTAEVVAEKERSEELLLNILPAETAEELKAYGSAQAKDYDMVTVLFTDFSGFTAMAKTMTPKDLIAEIDYCFSAFDKIMEKYDIEKIKTIGDSYMAAGGLPTTRPGHADDALAAAIEMRSFMRTYKSGRDGVGQQAFEMRIGLHSGPVIAGIVGIKKFAYDIWGDTVNIASRMESNGAVDRINISHQTYDLLIHRDNYTFDYRGKIEAKNRGELKMYFVDLVEDIKP